MSQAPRELAMSQGANKEPREPAMSQAFDEPTMSQRARMRQAFHEPTMSLRASNEVP